MDLSSKEGSHDVGSLNAWSQIQGLSIVSNYVRRGKITNNIWLCNPNPPFDIGFIEKSIMLQIQQVVLLPNNYHLWLCLMWDNNL